MLKLQKKTAQYCRIESICIPATDDDNVGVFLISAHLF